MRAYTGLVAQNRVSLRCRLHVARQRAGVARTVVCVGAAGAAVQRRTLWVYVAAQKRLCGCVVAVVVEASFCRAQCCGREIVFDR